MILPVVVSIAKLHNFFFLSKLKEHPVVCLLNFVSCQVGPLSQTRYPKY